MTLEEVLQNHCGLKGNAFKKNGRFNKQGAMAYDKLTKFIYDLECITDTFNANKVIDDLDTIEYEVN